MSHDSEAIVFLVDNSATSINGDFHPDRLEAQKIAVTRLANHFSRQSQKTQFALGTLAMPGTGIIASLGNRDLVTRSLLDVEPGEGRANVDKGIRCAILALHQCEDSHQKRRVIVMIGSETTPAWTQGMCDVLVRYVKLEKVILNIVAFGNDVETNPLRFIITELQNNDIPQSYFLQCPTNQLLSDAIIASPIGTPPDSQYDAYIDDPELEEVLRLSREDCREDPELARVLEESRLSFQQLTQAMSEAWEDGPKDKEDDKDGQGKTGQ